MQRQICNFKNILKFSATALSAVVLFSMLFACGDDAAETTDTTATETVLSAALTQPAETTTLYEEATTAEMTEQTTAETIAETTCEPDQTATDEILYDTDLAAFPSDSPEYELYRLFAEDIPMVEETLAETSFDEEGNVSEVTSTVWRDGDAAFYYKDMVSGETIVVNADKVFSAASMIKAVYVYTLLISADNGEIDLDEPTVYDTSMFVKGTGRFKDVESGSVFTVRELISYTMRYSDNTAYSMLRNRFGTAHFETVLEAAGISASKYSKWWSANVVQYGEFFAVLAEYFESDSENAAWLKNEMTYSMQRVMLQNALAPDAVAHKYGWDVDSYCDGGVAFSDDGTYAVVFMSDLDGGHYYGANTKFIYAVGDVVKEMRASRSAETSETSGSTAPQEVTE